MPYLVSVCDIPVSLGLELFDKLVAPILLYGSDVWGYKYRDSIEIIQRKYCKMLLGVSSSTQNDMVMGELGRLPLYTKYIPRCIKFWLNITASRSRYTKSCYDFLKRLDDVGKTTWASYIKYLLCSYGFGDVLLSQGVGNEHVFLSILTSRLCDTPSKLGTAILPIQHIKLLNILLDKNCIWVL